MKRPYSDYKIQELESTFKTIKNEKPALEALRYELTYRTTPRAKKLTEDVNQQIASINASKKSIIRNKSIAYKKMTIPDKTAHDFPLTQEQQNKGKNSDPVNTLNAWTALEVLSPQTFTRPEQLAQNGDRTLIKPITTLPLPWEGAGERSKPDFKLFYHIVLGTIHMPEAITALMEKFPDSRAERPANKGEAILASLLVNQDGTLVEENGASISSFGWGLAKVLNDELYQLGEWSNVEAKLTQDFFSYFKRVDVDGHSIPIEPIIIQRAFNWLIEKFGLPGAFLKQNPFIIKAYRHINYAGAPDPLLLNSFYLKDLSAAKTLFSTGKATPNLMRYLGQLAPKKTYDLFSENGILEQIVAPQNFAAARWPGAGRHPLVLLQQAAVNLSVNNLKPTGILPVNGPPGTGKTTLLRDIVAGLVTERARILLNYEDPKKAFKFSGEKIKAGNAWLMIYELDESLKGFEMLIASSNNKAVENVSAELPSIHAIANDPTAVRYFKTLSDAVHQKETWGICAAVLGNAANRADFMQRFWWDKETGLRTYLAAAAGKSQDCEETDPKTNQVRIRRPAIIDKEQAPAGPEEALVAWQAARQTFANALKNAENNTTDLALVRKKVFAQPALINAENKLNKALQSASLDRGQSELALKNINAFLPATTLGEQKAKTNIAAHRQTRPDGYQGSSILLPSRSGKP